MIHGKKITRHLGLVRGSSIRTRHVGHDILASLRGLIGGEIHEYTKLMAESREQVLDRLMVYGTAVFIEDADELVGG